MSDFGGARPVKLSRALLICCISVAISAAAQSSDPSQEVNKAKAYALVDDALRDAQDLRSPENKIVIYSQAANLIWERDPKRARGLYQEAIALYKQMAADPRRISEFRRMGMNSPLRQTLAMSMAEREPELALDFVRDTSAGMNKGLDRDLMARITTAIARKRPEKAMELADDSMASGDFSSLAQLVSTLPSLNKEAAKSLVNKAVSRIRSAIPSGDDTIAYAAMNLLQMDEGRSTETKMLTDEQRRSLARSAIAFFTESSRTPDSLGGGYDELMRKYAPAAWQDFVVSSKDKRQASGENPAVMEFRTLIQKGSLEEALAALERVPPSQRQGLANEMAWGAMAKGDTDLANKVITTYVTDDQQRDMMAHNMQNQRIELAVQKNDVALARTLMADAPLDPVERGSMFLRFGQMALARDPKDKAQALQFFEEALQQVPDPDDSNAFNFHVAIATSMLTVSPTRAAEIMSGLISRSNQMIAPLQSLDGFINGMRQFDQGEIRPVGNGIGVADVLIGALPPFGLDMDSGISLADTFEPRELKARAKLRIAETQLSPGGIGPAYAGSISVGGGVRGGFIRGYRF